MNFKGIKAGWVISLVQTQGNKTMKGGFPQSSTINFTVYHMPQTTSTLPAIYQIKENMQTSQTAAKYQSTTHIEITYPTSYKDF